MTVGNKKRLKSSWFDRNSLVGFLIKAKDPDSVSRENLTLATDLLSIIYYIHITFLVQIRDWKL